MDIVTVVILLICFGIAGYLFGSNQQSTASSNSPDSNNSSISAAAKDSSSSKLKNGKHSKSGERQPRSASDSNNRWGLEDMESDVEKAKEQNRQASKRQSPPSQQETTSESPPKTSQNSMSSENQIKPKKKVKSDNTKQKTPGKKESKTKNSAPPKNKSGEADKRSQKPETRLKNTSKASETDDGGTGIRGASSDDIRSNRGVGVSIDPAVSPLEDGDSSETSDEPDHPLWIVGLNKNLKDKVYRIDSLPASVGRHPNSDVQLESGDISRRHFEIVAKNGRHHLQPMDAENETVVNDSPVRLGETHEIQNEDYLQIGNTLFQFHLEEPKFGEEKTEKKKGLQFEASTAQVSADAMSKQLKAKLEEFDGDVDKAADALNLDKAVFKQLLEQFD